MGEWVNEWAGRGKSNQPVRPSKDQRHRLFISPSTYTRHSKTLTAPVELPGQSDTFEGASRSFLFSLAQVNSDWADRPTAYVVRSHEEHLWREFPLSVKTKMCTWDTHVIWLEHHEWLSGFPTRGSRLVRSRRRLRLTRWSFGASQGRAGKWTCMTFQARTLNMSFQVITVQAVINNVSKTFTLNNLSSVSLLFILKYIWHLILKCFI